jgi:hypothetical protein
LSLLSLQHIRRRRSTDRGLCLPATFRPQGFLALSTAYSLRCPAGFVSRRRRSWDSPFGAFSSCEVSGVSPPGSAHIPFPLPLYLPQKAAGRPGSPRFLGFCPRESPLLMVTLVNAPPAGCSLGFLPPRVYRQQPSPDSRPAPSRALRDEAMLRGRRLRVLIDHCLAAARIRGKPGTATTTLSGSSHLVSPDHSGNLPAGLCVRLTPCGTSLPTIGDL